MGLSSVQSLSDVRLSVTPWTAACQASLSITNSWSLLRLMSIKSVMLSNHLILCCSLLLPPSSFSSIRLFSNKSVLHIRWPKYWSFRLSISPSNEYSGLISFRMGWFDLLAVKGTLKCLLQHHSSKSSILRHSAFFIVQLTPIHDYRKNHRSNRASLVAQMVKHLPAMQETRVRSLSRKDPWGREWQPTPVLLPGKFHRQEEPGRVQPMGSQRVGHNWATSRVGKVMSLLFYMLSRFVIAFLPKSKCLLISWLQSPSAVILSVMLRK